MKPAFDATSRASAICSLVRGPLDSTSQPPGICSQPYRRRPPSVMKLAGLLGTCGAEEVLADFDLLNVREGELPFLGEARDYQVVSHDAAVDEEVRRSDRLQRGRSRDTSAHSGWRRRAPTRRSTPFVPLNPRIVSSSSTEWSNRSSPKTIGATPGCVALRSGITVARSSWAASWPTLAARAASSAGASTGVNSRSVLWAQVDPDLLAGQVRRLIRGLRLLGRGDDDDRCGDAERQRDRRQRRTGASLIASEVTQRQPRRDRDAAGDAQRTRGSPAGREAESR